MSQKYYALSKCLFLLTLADVLRESLSIVQHLPLNTGLKSTFFYSVLVPFLLKKNECVPHFVPYFLPVNMLASSIYK